MSGLRALGAASAFALALSIGAVGSGCGMQPRRPQVASLRIETEPLAARIYIDGRYMGAGRALSRRPVHLRPGSHQVTIAAPGFFPHDLELDLPVGETRVRAALRPVPP
ncbi:MAG: PEGA domain-containing protein [Myxococcales bacterium]|nr:PEGA domain-containing protein [Myxococcales bacterium]